VARGSGAEGGGITEPKEEGGKDSGHLEVSFGRCDDDIWLSAR
jgi:hypothetical protein